MKLARAQEDLQIHKDDAQAALDYYRQLVTETESMYLQIRVLLQQSKLSSFEKAKLKRLKKNFSAFLSADYMMSKNLPYWGESAQPGKTYYLMKLVCDVFGIIDHSNQGGYTYICDEVAAGAKSTSHYLIFSAFHYYPH